MWEFPASLEKPTGDAAYVGEVKHQLTHRTIFYAVFVERARGMTRMLPVCAETGARYAEACGG